MIQFRETTAVITGGVGGIGLQCIKYLLESGVKKCAILDMDKIKGEETEKLFTNPSKEVSVKYFHCDVSKMADYEAALLKVNDAFESFDLLINNASIIDEIDWERAIDFNVKGVINGVNLGMKFMGKNNGGKGGRIINMSSICALNPISTLPVYSATQFALNGITRSMGTQFYRNKTGVTVNALCSGVTETDLLYYINTPTEDDELSRLRKKQLTDIPLQKPELVADALIEILIFNGNGIVWMCESGRRVYEIEFPTRMELKREK